MAHSNIKFFILTGDPGVGKTTLTKKILSILSDKGIKVAGFYTEEVRNNRVREGFDIISLEGKRGRLARDQSLLNEPTKFKVGKYGVLVEEFEQIALPCLAKVPDNQTCLILDEIGKMEFFSTSFKLKIKEIFSPTSNNVVLATIPIRKSDAIIESIRNNSKSKIWVVSLLHANIALYL
ncbi:Cancer-related nucleoside-triphosphatase-like [Papilio xuthus]|uniref:Cancer-related nucleoside-triphosphatase-like n=1 Tax=Papilio xuthus TaxID=66420 RepID=A0A194QC99_PAPXU|nr:Cancer-related nucleoside-triphosphatase-like [Papilio xuthus]